MAKKTKTISHKSKASNHKPKDKPESQRGLWRGAISFGLVNVPVQMISARESKGLHFTMVDPSNLSPIGYKYYNKSTGEEVTRNQTVKAYEYKPDSYVLMNEADFKKANPKASQTIDIENFVQLSEIDPVFFEKAYYLVPSKGGEKGYKLLCEALWKSEKVAIAKMVLHTKQHLVAVIPRGNYLLLELLHFAEDVRELSELGDPNADVKISKNLSKEVEMAERLIGDMTSKWNPEEYKDTYRADILKHVQAKVKAGKATQLEDDFAESSEETSDSNVVDLMPLLRKSLEGTPRRKARSR